MAWIEVDQGIRKAIWIDGFLPPADFIEKARLQYIDVDTGGYLTKKPNLKYSKDQLFKRVAFVIRNYYEETKGESEMYHCCDMFLTRVIPDSLSPDQRKSLIQPEFKLGGTLKSELLKASKNKDYRQIIVTFSPYSCGSGDECTKQFIKKLDFKIRQPKDYKNFEEFKKDCERLLDEYFLEPYIAPCMVAEKRLDKLGLQEQEPDF